MKLNPLSMTDFYKTGHKFQYPDGTELVYSNATCRSDHHFKGLQDFDHKVVNFGLQGICQWMLIDHWNENFFNKPKKQVVGRHKRTIQKALNIQNFDASHLEALHDIGYLPIVIKALPEGARVNIKVPTYTIYNTRPDVVSGAMFGWLTNYLETQIQSESWKPKISATTAYEFRRLFERYADMTGVDKSFVDFQGHDFSMRGMSGIQDATQSGAGHLLSFKGTDTISAIEYLEDYYLGMGGYMLKDEDSETMKGLDTLLANLYHAGVKTVVDSELSSRASHFSIVQYENGDFGLEDVENPNVFIGGSVPATEHAVTCMNGQSGEIAFFDRLITEVYPSGIVSIVSDTWDFWKVVTEFTVELKDRIMARDGKVVIRPDSGDPVDIICGTAIPMEKFDSLRDALLFARKESIEYVRYFGRYYKVLPGVMASDWRLPNVFEISPSDVDMKMPYQEVDPTPEMKGAVECLWDVFGGTETDKNFKTLDSHIGLIYGDSINLDRAQRILQRLADKGFSSANIVFGIGSFTYQFVTRDTFGEAVKATFGIVNGEPREIFKDPKTGDGGKKSAKGLIRIEKEGDNYVLYDQQTWEQEAQGELKELFRDSQMVRIDSVFNIRDRLLNE
jgi:nicotinamide phosphoribosyltransferase